MPPKRSEDKELGYVFFKGDGSSFNEREDYGVAGDDSKGPLIFNDDQFKDELEMGDDTFVLIGKEVALNREILEPMFPLREEFSDVFHDELPDALPPLCDIQHHIDFVPSSKLTNRPHYRLCHGEHEELRRQDKSKPKVKNNVKSEVPILRSRSKCKPEVKAKAYVRVLKSNENLDSDEVDFESSALVKSQKIKTKAELMRKMNGGSDSDSPSLDEEKVMRFSAFHNVPIDKIPFRLGRYMVANFDSETYRMSLDSGDYVEVTPSKIHGILGIPVGGDLLFSFKERPIEHDLLDACVRIVLFLKLIGAATFIVALKTVNSQRKELCNVLVHLHSSLVTYLVTMEVRRLTPDRMATRASKTKVVPKITRLEFTIGNYLFAMQGDKMEKVFESHSGEFIVYGVSLNMETLAPGLWIDAHTKSMFDRTLVSNDGKWESFSNQVKAQPKGKENGLALEGLICLTKTTSMTILDNSRATYDSKYKEVCDLLILLHEVNVHAKKKLDLANESDKVDAHERMSIIVKKMKKREECDRM
nr:putative reverse transcriptase domain-containing protein [Tanacetum cinerariifolium]